MTNDEKAAEAKELFGRGSRNYCMKQYSDAADDLSSCCAIYSELHGPTAVECGVPYLLYAKSLIALGKDENNLIVPGEEEEGEEDNDEDGGEEGGEEGEEDGEGDAEGEGEEKASADKEEKPEEKKEKSDEKSEAMATEKSSEKSTENGDLKKDEKEAGSSSKVEAEPQPGPSTSNGTGQQEETEEGEDEKGGGNLEVAWEILELAVKIFEEQGDKSLDNLSECYTELAGISFENSHFTVAINDYKKALAVYDKTGKSDSRLTAEIYYKVGLCYLMLNEFEDSIKSFREACSELDKVIEQEKAKEQTDETKETIKDLEETKQEIVDKITEVEETKKTSIEEVKRELSKIIVKGETTNGFDGAGPSSAPPATNGSSSSSTKSVEKPTDISHLVKRKKPDTATTEVEGSPAKKTAVEADKSSD